MQRHPQWVVCFHADTPVLTLRCCRFNCWSVLHVLSSFSTPACSSLLVSFIISHYFLWLERASLIHCALCPVSTYLFTYVCRLMVFIINILFIFFFLSFYWLVSLVFPRFSSSRIFALLILFKAFCVFSVSLWLMDWRWGVSQQRLVCQSFNGEEKWSLKKDWTQWNVGQKKSLQKTELQVDGYPPTPPPPCRCLVWWPWKNIVSRPLRTTDLWDSTSLTFRPSSLLRS